MTAPACSSCPPSPSPSGDNWPLLTVSKGFFEGVLAGDISASDYVMEEGEDAGAGWGDDLDLDLGGDEGAKEKEEDPLAGLGLGDDDEREGDGEDDGSDAGWDMEDLELPADLGAGADDGADAGVSEVFVAPTAGVPVARRWTQKSAIPGEHAAAGDFDSAMKLLNRQLGVVNFAPLRQHFIDAALATHAAMSGVTSAPSLSFPLGRNWNSDLAPGVGCAPALVSSLPLLEDRLKVAYKTTTRASLARRSRCSRVSSTPSRFSWWRPGARLTRCGSFWASPASTPARFASRSSARSTRTTRRAAELAAYFTHCAMQPIHLSLSLRSAMSIFFKLKNFNTAAEFSRRLLELSPPVKVAQQAKQVLQACERENKDEVELEYDSRNPFVVCAATFTPIYRGTADVACPTCGARFVKEQEGTVCPVCNLGKVGADATGLVCGPEQRK